jgi:hypothetical protein
MDYRVSKDVMRNNISGLKRGDVFRLGEYAPTEDNYFIFLEEIHKGPENEDNYYRLWHFRHNCIVEVNCTFLEGQDIHRCEAILEIKDNG